MRESGMHKRGSEWGHYNSPHLFNQPKGLPILIIAGTECRTVRPGYEHSERFALVSLPS